MEVHGNAASLSFIFPHPSEDKIHQNNIQILIVQIVVECCN